MTNEINLLSGLFLLSIGLVNKALGNQLEKPFQHIKKEISFFHHTEILNSIFY